MLILYISTNVSDKSFKIIVFSGYLVRFVKNVSKARFKIKK